MCILHFSHKSNINVYSAVCWFFSNKVRVRSYSLWHCDGVVLFSRSVVGELKIFFDTHLTWHARTCNCIAGLPPRKYGHDRFTSFWYRMNKQKSICEPLSPLSVVSKIQLRVKLYTCLNHKRRPRIMLQSSAKNMENSSFSCLFPETRDLWL